jgi:hypothetical protein
MPNCRGGGPFDSKEITSIAIEGRDKAGGSKSSDDDARKSRPLPRVEDSHDLCPLSRDRLNPDALHIGALQARENYQIEGLRLIRCMRRQKDRDNPVQLQESQEFVARMSRAGFRAINSCAGFIGQMEKVTPRCF